MLRRLRYAAAIVIIGALVLLLGSYVVAYLTREAASTLDGPLVVVLVTALLILLGIKVSTGTLTGGLLGTPPREKKDDG